MQSSSKKKMSNPSGRSACAEDAREGVVGGRADGAGGRHLPAATSSWG